MESLRKRIPQNQNPSKDQNQNPPLCQNQNPSHNPPHSVGWKGCCKILSVGLAVLGFFWMLNHSSSFLVACQSPPLQDPRISPQVFHSDEVFKKDYFEMERDFKIFMYPNRDKDAVCHDGRRRLNGKYGSEEYFFQNLQQSQFLTTDPDKAHLFFIPISCHKWRKEDYLRSLIAEYPYWNRTLGADHFFVTCQDIGMTAVKRIPHLRKNSIRVVCSPNYKLEYVPRKDIPLPPILEQFALPAPQNNMKKRTVLAFWIGRRSSNIRNKLIQIWQNDTELDIQNKEINISGTKRSMVYQEKFYRSKFCVCPGALHVHGARIPHAIQYGCVPVILSDYTVLTFHDILDWRKFSVILRESEVYKLKEILAGIPEQEYKALQTNTVKVQKHFQWNTSPVKLDAFHMVMYELWLRRHVVRYEQVANNSPIGHR